MSAENESVVRKRLLEYFAERGVSVDPDTDLFESNALDSMGVLELVAFVEEKLGVELSQDVMQADNFRTVEAVARTVAAAAAESEGGG